MILHDFSYCKPVDKKELFNILQQPENKCKVLAGGTDLILGLKNGSVTPKMVVDLKGLQLDFIQQQKKGLVIGACATLESLENSNIIMERYPAFWEAVTQMATPAVRHRATVGGNLCHASPSADTAPPLLVYEARAGVESLSGYREISFKDFFIGPGLTQLKEGEILSCLVLPPIPAGVGTVYLKHSRTEKDLAIIGVAAYLSVKEGICRNSRIALGAVAEKPFRAKKAEQYLIGKYPSPETFKEAAELAVGEARPINDQRASAQYRVAMVFELTKRALERALSRAGGR